jgi:hypothetical protein
MMRYLDAVTGIGKPNADTVFTDRRVIERGLKLISTIRFACRCDAPRRKKINLEKMDVNGNLMRKIVAEQIMSENPDEIGRTTWHRTYTKGAVDVKVNCKHSQLVKIYWDFMECQISRAVDHVYINEHIPECVAVRQKVRNCGNICLVVVA